MDPSLFPFLFGGLGGLPDPATYAPAPYPSNPFESPGFSNPGAMDAAIAGAPYQAPATVAGSVGGNVANAPPGEPMNLAPPNPGSMGAVPGGVGGARAQAANPASMLQQSLRGVQAMQPPAPQKVATPHAPQLARVQPSQLINTLASLGIGPAQAVGLGLGRIR